MGRHVVHFEVIGADGEALRRFYGELFEWSPRRPGPGDYGLTSAEDSGVTGGIGGAPGHAPYVTIYVGVPDVGEALERAVALGGERVSGPTAVGEGVEVGMLRDPEGHLIGVMRQG
jgi:predicted enzyme related to lactoylglutathione lyase